jgi:hypothetical protein
LEERDSLDAVLQFMKSRLKKAKERDRHAERYVEATSRLLWRWREPWLLAFAVFMALMDYASTYAILALSGKSYFNEAGSLASWALEKGGFAGLFLADLAAISAISLTAITLRFILFRSGFRGFGRAAFVFLLVPYVVMAMVAVVNNLILTYW